MKNITEKISEGFVFFDGGCGSILQAAGLMPGELPETWNIKRPEVIQQMHLDYLCNGVNILKTNTFGANILKYKDSDGEYSLENIIDKAVFNAKEAIRMAETATNLDGKPIEDTQLIKSDHYIALDIGPLGKLLKPFGDLSFDEAVDIFKRTIEIGSRKDVDLILIETMSDIYEAKAAIIAAKESCNLPIFLTCAFDESAKLLTGADPKTVVTVAEALGVMAVGVNCSLGPDMMLDIVKELYEYASLPVICNPNAGLPKVVDGKTVYDFNPDRFKDAMIEIAKRGARIIGGCCGTTPAHIGATAKALESMTALELTEKDYTLISSYTHCVEFNKKPILIGERINPTGKSKFKQALRDHNIDYILQEAINQQDKRADVLDVNVGLPEIDEVSMMEEVVFELQTITDLPLQIDTTNMEAMEKALRHYNGKAMINSVNGKREVMEQVFPLVKKYGGLLVALTIDEDGIPDTAEGRLKIVDNIYKKAAEYGIKAKDIIIDPLAMSISADSNSAMVTLESLKLIKERYNGKTSLGVSNVSFGLPKRDLINASFFTMAMQNGLNAAIMNPNSENMMKAYYTYCALNAIDINCSNYIEYASSLLEETVVKKDNLKSDKALENISETNKENCYGDCLTEAIVKGLKERAASYTAEYLNNKEAIEIIDSYLIPALNIVGKGFEEKRFFLPQLLMSAEAAKCSFDVIKETMEKEGKQQTKKGKVIIATVKGDIHDIGKNIVKVLLENYAYDVIDLGKDVLPEVIVNKAKEESVKLIGLSALMTTTVPSMEETIKLLREEGIDAKVCVGGAVLTQEYADMIAADKYVKDAMDTVRYAEEILG